MFDKKITHFRFETILYPSMYDSASSDINAPSPARSYNGTSLWVISVVSTATSIRACFDGLSIQKGCEIQIQVVNVLKLRITTSNHSFHSHASNVPLLFFFAHQLAVLENTFRLHFPGNVYLLPGKRIYKRNYYSQTEG